MRLLALTWKNLAHHGMAMGFATVLFACLVFVAWAFQLSEARPSLMEAATGLLYYVGPLYVLFLNDRLVAQDWADRTSEFLMALPMGGVLRLGVPFVVGLAVIAVVAECTVLSTALLASRREGLTLGWMALLHLQVGTYLLAWHALAFGIAHTGRYRTLVWWTIFVGVVSLEGGWVDDPWRTLLWHAPLADPIQQARSLPPWDAFPLALGWAALGVGLAAFLGTWRGGALSARWFRASDSRSRASLLVAGVMVLMAGPVVEETAPERDAWRSLEPLPARSADVRVAGKRLRPVGERVVAILDGFSVELGGVTWPRVVLYPASRGNERHVRPAVDTASGVVLMVDDDGPQDKLVQDVLLAVFELQLGAHTESIGAVDWIHGAPGWLAPADTDEVLDALWRGPRDDGTAVWRAAGEDVGRAVMAARLKALEASSGRDAVLCGLRPLLSHTRGLSWFDWIALRLRNGDFAARCPALPAAPRPSLDVDAPPLPSVAVVQDGDALEARFSWAAPMGSILMRTEVDALESHPALWNQRWLSEPAGRRTEVPLDFPPSAPAAAELVMWWEPAGGWLSSGRVVWEARP